MSQTTRGDPIVQLPVDQTPMTDGDLQLVNALFKNNRGRLNNIYEGSKDALIAGVLFAIFSLDQVSNLVKRCVSSAENSPYILILVKAILFAVTFWVIKHFYLSRGN